MSVLPDRSGSMLDPRAAPVRARNRHSRVGFRHVRRFATMVNREADVIAPPAAC